MGKPRMIILIRHAQSEGNQNRQIHQTIPDHRVKLTSDGWTQAHDAGRRLRSMLRPTDTLQFYTSPYRRTRETTDGILATLTVNDETSGEASPFPRDAIKVWEEPRLREQDFGNFQPCSAAMERMWQERADYGHFFYRIPNGESAADAYDRVSGFNESLWRSFQEDDFPSVCVLVTHGLMTRVFLMKWFHWSVEGFEDLRNVNHCEFVVMVRDADEGQRGKFVLQNKLRTWTELKRQRAIERGEDPNAKVTSPPVAKKRWGGCPEGCSHEHDDYPTRAKRRDTKDLSSESNGQPPRVNSLTTAQSHTKQEIPVVKSKEEDDEAFPKPKENDAPSPSPLSATISRSRFLPTYLEAGRDFGGSGSGAPTPLADTQNMKEYSFTETAAENETGDAKPQRRGTRPSIEDDAVWMAESGMATGARADALGDQGSEEDDEVEAEKTARESVY